MARLREFPKTALALLAIWCVAVGYGFWRMTRYDLTPGARAVTPSDWPAGLTGLAPALKLAGGTAKTLVLFAHPLCPCTRATIGNIAAALAHEPSPAGVRVYVALFEPSAASGPEWRDSDLARSARNLPNATLIYDPGGVLARRFGAETSGQTLVYDSAGRLLFSGGMTDERGHYGDSDGGDALAAIARGDAPALRSTPVYGCSLLPARAVEPRFPLRAGPMSMPMGGHGASTS